MNKIEVTLQNVVEKITKFYDPTTTHFLTLNGVAIDETKTEIQWIFADYMKLNDNTVFYVVVDQEDVVPSIVEVIPSAIMSQREVVDMFGIEVQNSAKGLYLDEDSLQKPLSGGCTL
ncbi:MAG: NADH dehydrogenase FAD-containing subunit [Helicobacteraceae bacterium]|nr:NADH dehydrogenase FAD-containing subunit [Helicobacteraceae bacterium]